MGTRSTIKKESILMRVVTAESSSYLTADRNMVKMSKYKNSPDIKKNHFKTLIT